MVPELLNRLPLPRKWKRWLHIIADLSTLLGGFALRWAVLFAGHDSANDPEADREVSRANH